MFVETARVVGVVIDCVELERLKSVRKLLDAFGDFDAGLNSIKLSKKSGSEFGSRLRNFVAYARQSPQQPVLLPPNRRWETLLCRQKMAASGNLWFVVFAVFAGICYICCIFSALPGQPRFC